LVAPLLEMRQIKEQEMGNSSKLQNLEYIEKEHILKALINTNWQLARASESLQISRSTLWRKLKKYGISLQIDVNKTVK